MTPLEIVLAIVAGLGAIITAVVGYIQHQNSKREDTRNSLVTSTLDRVTDLEKRTDQLTTQLLTVSAQSSNEREEIRKEYEAKVEAVRKEMRRLIDDSNFELSTWRDKYFTLIESYQKLKLEYASMEVRFDKLDKEYQELRTKYENLIVVKTQP